MTKIYYGCDEIPRNWKRYFGICNALETDLKQLDNPPKIATLNRWRVDSPKGFAFILHADSLVSQELVKAAERGEEALSEELQQGWQQTLEQARALAARAILIQTPASFSPGTASRALLTAFSKELRSAFSRPVIWEAQGIWDTAITREWAADLGLTYTYDPFLALREEIGLLHGDGAFILTERAGMRREFDRFDISGLLDQLQSYNRAFFLLRGRFKWNHAHLFLHELAE